MDLNTPPPPPPIARTRPIYEYIKVPVAPNYEGVCLQNTSKPHSYHLKI